MPKPAIIERAYELAGSGRCCGIADIIKELKSENYANVAEHFYGVSIRQALTRICVDARKADKPGP